MKIRIRSLLHAAPAVAAAAVGLGVAQPARAQTACSTLPHPVIVSGSSAVKPFLQALAAKLTPNITIIYPNGTGSCDGVAAMSTTPVTVNSTGALYWDSSAVPVPGGCDFDIAGNAVDIGASDVYADTCGKTLATDVHDFHGPIQTMTFAVPSGSTATSISAEAAYMVYGFAADTAAHQVSPWTDPASLFQRDASSGTETMIATAIKVPAAKWLAGANTNKTSDAIFAALTGAADASKALGILGASYADLHRDKVKELAYQAYGQSCGYLPDSNATAFDKANVRDGHYEIWGPLHLYTHVGSNGKSSNADIQKVIDDLTLVTPDPGFDLIQLEAKNGVIPECAMHVSRTAEVGALASYDPPKSCECKFVKEATGTAPADCATCTTNADCTAGNRHTCNYGFCEVH